MKLREELSQVNRNELFQVLCELEKELNDVEYTLEECKEAYTPVIEELLSKPVVDTPSKIFVIREGTGPAYYNVEIVDDVKSPAESASLGVSKWSDIASARIICNSNELDLPHKMAYILWELTYDGWSEEEHIEFHKNLNETQ